MNGANDPAVWQNFYIMIGTANAAITGLLFVALSLHLKQILAHPIYKPRAVLVLGILTTQIVISAIVLSPQTRVLMGIEVLILNLFFLALNARYRQPAQPTAGSAIAVAIRIVYLWSAVSLIIGVGGGFYVLGAILTVTIVRSLTSCWALLTALDDEPAA